MHHYLRYANRILGRGEELLLDKENATGHTCNSTDLQTVNTQFMLMQLPNTLCCSTFELGNFYYIQRDTGKIKNVVLWLQERQDMEDGDDDDDDMCDSGYGKLVIAWLSSL
jgi:hypothetical protein